MAYTIFDEVSLHHQASKLESIATKYDAMLQDLKSSTAPLHSQWQGPARDAWVSERDALLKDIETTSAELRNIASSIWNYTANMHYLLEEIVEAVTDTVD